MNSTIPKPPIIQTLESLSLPFKLLIDWEVPWYAKFVPISLFIVYLFLPIDLITDFIPVVGLFDDAAAFAGCSYLLIKLTPTKILNKYLSQNDNQTTYPPKIIEIEEKSNK